MLSVKQEAHSVLTSEAYQHMTKAELETQRNYVMAELERHNQLGKGERQQLEQLENWENPNFRQLVG